ncbi:MAG: carboxypeptidase-like regulatory domain-containing protein, partial [Candidatus Sulfotelmatobacter sp.]
MNPGYFHFRRLPTCLAGLVLMALIHGLVQPTNAQEPNAPIPTESTKPDVNLYGVAGTVVNSITGEPIRRAAVNISGQTERATLSDNSGHFEFGGLAEGRLFIGVTKPGFFSEQGALYGLTPLQVGPDAAPVVLRMVPAGVIVGRVTTRDEQPLEGFQVHALTKQSLGGRQVRFDRLFLARTDENGDFRLANLPAATYYVQVDQSQETTLGQPGIPNAREQVYAKVFYPGVSDFSASAPLELRAGQQLEANFTLTAEPIYQISGILSTHENLSSPLTFSRTAGEDYDFTQVTPTQDGKYQSKLPAGSYAVSGYTANGVLLSSPGASVVISSDSPAVHVVLASSASIEVVIRTELSG